MWPGTLEAGGSSDLGPLGLPVCRLDTEPCRHALSCCKPVCAWGLRLPCLPWPEFRGLGLSPVSPGLGRQPGQERKPLGLPRPPLPPGQRGSHHDWQRGAAGACTPATGHTRGGPGSSPAPGRTSDFGELVVFLRLRKTFPGLEPSVAFPESTGLSSPRRQPPSPAHTCPATPAHPSDSLPERGCSHCPGPRFSVSGSLLCHKCPGARGHVLVL